MHTAACIICGTPRSGSTLLRDLLGGTGVAGRPHAYFRPPSIADFAAGMGVSLAQGTEGPDFDRAYLAAVLETGRAGTGMFGLMLMWDAVAGLAARLDRLFPGLPSDAARFERAFGPARYLYLSREDKVAQAVSRLKAEQSGLWHLNADGSERKLIAPRRRTTYDAAKLRAYLDEVAHDEAAWHTWFSANRIVPHRLTYEQLAADSQGVLASVLSVLGLDPSQASAAEVLTAPMADAESRAWAARFRAEC